MIEFLCLPQAAPFCVSAEYAPTVHIGSLDYQGDLFQRSVPADEEARARLGVEVTFGFPDVGRQRDRSMVRETCGGERCIRFVVDCEQAALTCTWDIAARESDGRYFVYNFISMTARSRQSMNSALQNLAFDLGGGVRVTLASTIDAPQVSAD